MDSSRMRTVRYSDRLMGRCPGGSVCLGVSTQGRVYTSPLPWTEFLTHACENITFPQLRLQTVITKVYQTRMHSSRMRTVRSSGRLRGGGPSHRGGVPGHRGKYLVTGVPGHLVRYSPPPPPVNRITDRYKNITFAISLRTVTRTCVNHQRSENIL